jgi:phosphatidyl-myo-inositol dimannoside synthase
MKKATILFLLNEAFLRQGGMERFNRHMCMVLQRYCSKYDFDCLVISKNDSSFDDRYINATDTFKFIGCGGNKFLFVLQYLKALIILRGVKLSIFGILNHVPLAALTPGNLKRVSIIHGFEAWEELPGWKRVLLSFFTEFWSVSEYTREEFSKRNNVNADKIRLLHNSLDYFWHEDNEKEVSEEPYILCVTRLDSEQGHYKGVDQLIRSFSEISGAYPKYRLVIVGIGTDIDRLRNLANMEGIADKVQFLESVPDADLKKLYSRCTIFALPSKKEGFGIVFLEAMAAKKPVIGGNHGGTPEVIDDGETGFLVQHSNESELIFALRQLLTSRELRAKMGNKGYRKLTEGFLYNKFESTLFLYLSELLMTSHG